MVSTIISTLVSFFTKKGNLFIMVLLAVVVGAMAFLFYQNSFLKTQQATLEKEKELLQLQNRNILKANQNNQKYIETMQEQYKRDMKMLYEQSQYEKKIQKSKAKLKVKINKLNKDKLTAEDREFIEMLYPQKAKQ